MITIDKEVLDILKSKCPGAQWAAYANQALDSFTYGQLKFLAIGETCTFQTPPECLPDGDDGAGWKYRFQGVVDLDTGEVKEGDSCQWEALTRKLLLI